MANSMKRRCSLVTMKAWVIVSPLRRCVAGGGAAWVLSCVVLRGGDSRDAFVDAVAEFAPAGATGGFDVAKTEPNIGVGFVDGHADKSVAVIDANFGDVAGIVPDGDGVTNKGCQRRGEIPLALEVDSVPLHDPVLRNGEE